MKRERATAWEADIGCYDYGKRVNLSHCRNLKQALSKANELMKTTTFHPPIENPYVVQVYRHGKIVFDYMNGGY